MVKMSGSRSKRCRPLTNCPSELRERYPVDKVVAIVNGWKDDLSSHHVCLIVELLMSSSL